eukprot:6456807-Amphidinium_carterae.1
MSSDKAPRCCLGFKVGKFADEGNLSKSIGIQKHMKEPPQLQAHAGRSKLSLVSAKSATQKAKEPNTKRVLCRPIRRIGQSDGTSRISGVSKGIRKRGRCKIQLDRQLVMLRISLQPPQVRASDGASPGRSASREPVERDIATKRLTKCLNECCNS